MNQKLAVAVLEKFGYRVEAVADGREAGRRRRPRRLRPRADGLPDAELDGYAAAHRDPVRRQNGGPRIPIVAMTVSAMQGERERCLAAGMDHDVTKPIDRRRLQEVVDQLVGAAAPEPRTEEVPWRPERRSTWRTCS